VGCCVSEIIKIKTVGKIGNYYGNLCIAKTGDSYYWSIEDYDGDRWEEISKSLYDELLHHENESTDGKLIVLNGNFKYE
jgi:hypothetical protein